MPSYEEDLSEFERRNAQVLGISVDFNAANTAFAERLGLRFPLLSDTRRVMTREYGVLNDKGTAALRWTYYIGADGKILHIDKTVKTESHGADVAAKLGELGVKKKS